MKTAQEWARAMAARLAAKDQQLLWHGLFEPFFERCQREAIEAAAEEIEDHEGDALPMEKLAAYIRALTPPAPGGKERDE